MPGAAQEDTALEKVGAEAGLEVGTPLQLEEAVCESCESFVCVCVCVCVRVCVCVCVCGVRVPVSVLYASGSIAQALPSTNSVRSFGSLLRHLQGMLTCDESEKSLISIISPAIRCSPS